MKQAYKEMTFRGKSPKLIIQIDSIINEYQAQRQMLTVRQLYYQLVARGIIENTERSYKNITDLINNARMAGLLDWSAIEDRNREVVTRGHWTTPGNMLDAAISSYHEDLWTNQDTRVMVVVEKAALAGVLMSVCHHYDVPFLAARGYPSSSVLREFAIGPMQDAINDGQRVVILHLGDHDPSGLDMTRDLTERFELFLGEDSWKFELERIALSMDQVDEIKPPPNPAKTTDSRFADYRKKFGDESWELDALSPDYLTNLVETHIEAYIDEDKFDQRKQEVEDGRNKLKTLHKFL